MARFVAAHAADNLFLSGFEIVFDPGVVFSGATSDHLTATLGGTSIALHGTNFTYGGGGGLNGGTITSYVVSTLGATDYTASELSLSAGAFASATDIANLRDLVSLQFAGRDILIGSPFGDRLQGAAGRDVVRGNDGDDILFGGAGKDRLKGGDGNDEIIGGRGKDRINGGAGLDTADYSDTTADVVLRLRGSHESTVQVDGRREDTIKNVENIAGSEGRSKLIGDGHANHFQTLRDDDVVKGHGGDDFMLLRGGNDRVNGGGGHDTFSLQGVVDGNAVVTIADFHSGIDTIRLGETFRALPFNRVDPSHFVVGTDARDADDFLIYDRTRGKLYYDHDGVGGDAKLLFAKVTLGLHVESSDFDVVF